MLYLAFDTSSNKGGVAVLRDHVVLASKSWSREGSHGELLTPALEACLAEAGCQSADIEAIAIGHGPGSFTGVRVAVNAARTLAYALEIPVYAFDTSEILAEAVTHHEQSLAVLVNAHKNLLFASTFKWQGGRWRRHLPLAAYDLKFIEEHITTPHLCVGDAFGEFAPSMSSALQKNLLRDSDLPDEPSAEIVGLMAHKYRTERKPLVWKDVQALYIRPSGAEEKLREGAGR